MEIKRTSKMHQRENERREPMAVAETKSKNETEK